MLCKYGNYQRNHISHLSPTLNGSLEIRRFECSDAIEIRNGIIFDFYTGLPHLLHVFVFFLVGGADTGGLVPVNTARFQILDVDVRCDIRTFVQREGLIFKPGRGFYEFTKPEKISDKKEVVLVDKVSQEMCD